MPEMSNMALQEVLLLGTFLLTLLNIINGWNSARSRKMSTEPAITDIQKQQIAITADLSYIRQAIDAQGASNSTINAQINDIIVRLTKLEEAVKALQQR